MMTGSVSLVGAGPGDPELLTLRAVRRLREADLVLYDALVPTDILAFASPARRFYVGKRAGRVSIEQDAINRLMIREARRGRRIVRLKCGDPFVFGRGGEEALALAAAGIRCEIVPGLTTAVAARDRARLDRGRMGRAHAGGGPAGRIDRRGRDLVRNPGRAPSGVAADPRSRRRDHRHRRGGRAIASPERDNGGNDRLSYFRARIHSMIV
jgi:precorrin-6B methylase 1